MVVVKTLAKLFDAYEKRTVSGLAYGSLGFEKSENLF
jgi:hypothetical protein